MNVDDDVNGRLVYTGLLCVAITYSMYAGKSQNVAEEDHNMVLQTFRSMHHKYNSDIEKAHSAIMCLE